MSTNDPLLDESCTDYLNRMLGAPGTPARSIDTYGAYQRYLTIWDNAWRERTQRLRIDNIASYSLDDRNGVYRFTLNDGGVCLCPGHLLPIAVLVYVSDQ